MSARGSESWGNQEGTVQLVKSETIVAIDPGQKKSGIVVFDGVKVIYRNAEMPNDLLVVKLAGSWSGSSAQLTHLAIEMVDSYGMAVGASVFETVLWTGRFVQAFGAERCTLIYRKDVKLFLCNSMRAKDANVRRAVLDIFPAIGGGKTPQIGTKKDPGPLYGVTSHAMSALAVALTHLYSPKHGG